ncbi:MAG: 3-hydroxyacyl-CoA dehydrogenase family protein [Bacteroidales bacterium]|nr:3-hydroxyacyl-CoA dehydrogenase family protein [Bacteroidales bacterium]
MSKPEESASSIQTVGVIGEGQMGTSIFYSLADSSYSLRWIGSENADIPRLQHNFEKKIRRALKTGIMSQEQHDQILRQTIITNDLNVTADCDLVIEAIPEELPIKQTLFTALNDIVKPSGILASNSSSINPSNLFTGTKRDDRIIGMHYFYPVPLKESVELVTTCSTASDVRANVVEFLHNSGKFILELNESNSFILNKIYFDIQNEAYKIAEQGKATVEQLDLLVKEGLFPLGLFDFMDHIGIDTMLNSVKNYVSCYPQKDTYSGLLKRLQGMVDEGNLGRKSGAGFYRYQESQQITPHAVDPLPEETAGEIIQFLRFTYLSAAKRFTMLSGCTTGEMNQAIREYLGIEKGPFE